MNTLSSPAQQWQALLEQPLSFIRQQPVDRCFPDTLTTQQLKTLRTAPRFQARLMQLLQRHYGLQPLASSPQPEAQDLPVLLLSPEDFQRLPRVCGAIWHGATLSREIRGNVVSELRRLLGNEVFALALAHRGLSGAADLLRQPAQLLEAIDRDGASLVSGWLQAQPAQLQPWLRLRFDTPKVDDPRVPGDLNIVCVAAATFTRSDEEVA